MVAPTTGGYGIYLQLADECASIPGLHDGGFRDPLRFQIEKPNFAAALQLAAGPVPGRRNCGADCRRGAEPFRRSVGRDSHDDESRDIHRKVAANCFGWATGTGAEAEATAFEAIAAAADTAGQNTSVIAGGDQGIRGATVAHCRIQWTAGV